MYIQVIQHHINLFKDMGHFMALRLPLSSLSISGLISDLAGLACFSSSWLFSKPVTSLDTSWGLACPCPSIP